LGKIVLLLLLDKGSTLFDLSIIKNFETLIINRFKDSGIVFMSLEEYNYLMAPQEFVKIFKTAFYIYFKS